MLDAGLVPTEPRPRRRPRRRAAKAARPPAASASAEARRRIRAASEEAQPEERKSPGKPAEREPEAGLLGLGESEEGRWVRAKVAYLDPRWVGLVAL